MNWILDHLGIVIFAVVVFVQIVRGILTARREQPKPLQKRDELEEQRRVRDIQEQIRRRIAERRGGGMPEAEAPPPLARAEREPVRPPPRRPETTQLPDVFEGPLRRVFEEIERRAQPAPQPVPPPPPPLVERRGAEIERQEQLAEQMRVLEETRVLVERRAAQQAAAVAARAQTGTALREVARRELLADLHDRRSLQRAFVLREVLGPPVGLR